MKKYIHKVVKDLGYKLSNISKKEKEVQYLVRSFAVQNDKNDLVLESASFLFEIKKQFPEVTLESQKEAVVTPFMRLQLYLESSEEFFILNEVFIEKDYNLLSNES